MKHKIVYNKLLEPSIRLHWLLKSYLVLSVILLGFFTIKEFTDIGQKLVPILITQHDTVRSERILRPSNLVEMPIVVTHSIATDHNNPGCLVPGDQEVDKYAIGKMTTPDGRKFLSFHSKEYGWEALRKYIQKHSSMTVRSFIHMYAPPKENNTELYVVNVCKKLGALPTSKVIDYLSKVEVLMNAIAEIEGFDSNKSQTHDANLLYLH